MEGVSHTAHTCSFRNRSKNDAFPLQPCAHPLTLPHMYPHSPHTPPLTLHRCTHTLASLPVLHHSYIVTSSSNNRYGRNDHDNTPYTSGLPCFLMFISAKEHTSPTPDTSMVKLRRKSTMSEALFLRKKKRMKGVTSGLTSSP